MKEGLEEGIKKTDGMRICTLVAGKGGVKEEREQNKIPCWQGIEKLEETLGAGNVVYDNIERHNVGLDITEEYVKRGIKSCIVTRCRPNGDLIYARGVEQEYRLDDNRSIWVLVGYYIRESGGKYHIGLGEPKGNPMSMKS